MEIYLSAPILPSSATATAMKRSVRQEISMAAQQAQLQQQEAAGRNGESKLQLSEEEQAQVRRLQARDAEVRAHENAHLAAAGGYAKGGARYTYQTGPDGNQYAVGGQVSLDIGAESDPRQTLQKAITVQAAALAPASPSGQDMRVAGKAAMMANEARAEIIQEQREEFAVNDEANADRQPNGSGGITGEIGRQSDGQDAPVIGFGEAQQLEGIEQENERKGALNFIARMVGNRYGFGLFEGPRASFLAYG